MDVGGSGGGRGGAAALALLGLRRGQAADALARAARSWPRAAGGRQQRLLHLACIGVGLLTWWLTVDGASRGGERRLLCSAHVRVGPPTHRLALPACGPGWR